MLLNEFLKEHRTVRELKSAAAKQEATIARQEKQIEALTAGLQKVSAQLEVSKPTANGSEQLEGKEHHRSLPERRRVRAGVKCARRLHPEPVKPHLS
jgi:uncharacterized coiled-coil protein SlyX